MAAALIQRVLLASPRGYCAGVERAVETVERALALYGPPVYVRKQIVHNLHVVRDLEERGAVFVEHEDDVDTLEVADPNRIAYLTQTTLSVDETAEILDVLRQRFPNLRGPQREDICYATSNRQWAVKELLPEIDLLLVIGSRNSSNSNRLVEVARASGVASYLIDDETDIREEWLDGVETAGVTSGASAPEKLVARVCDWFRARGVEDITPYKLVEEDVEFRLPVELRRELALAEAQR